jgi:hypothetical protein
LCAHRTLASLVTCWRQVWHFGVEGLGLLLGCLADQRS